MKSLIRNLAFFLLSLYVSSCLDDNSIVKKNSEDVGEVNYAFESNKNAKYAGYSYWFFYKSQSSSNLRYAYSDDGVIWNGNIQFNNNAKSSTGPAVAYIDGKFVAVYKGNTTTRLYSSYSYDGITWYGNTPIGNAKTNDSPTIVVYNNKLFVYYTGDSTSDIWNVTSLDGINWSAQSLIYGGGLTIPASNGAMSAIVDHTTNQMYIFYWAADNIIHYRTSMDGSNFGPRQFMIECADNYAKTNVGVAATFKDGVLYVVYKGLSNHLYISYIDCYGRWRSIPINNAETSNRPGVVYINGKFTVVFKGLSTSNIFYSQSIDGVNWTLSTVAIGQTSGGGPFLVAEP